MLTTAIWIARKLRCTPIIEAWYEISSSHIIQPSNSLASITWEWKKFKAKHHKTTFYWILLPNNLFTIAFQCILLHNAFQWYSTLCRSSHSLRANQTCSSALIFHVILISRRVAWINRLSQNSGYWHAILSPQKSMEFQPFIGLSSRIALSHLSRQIMSSS